MDAWTVMRLLAVATQETLLLFASATTTLMTLAASAFLNSLSVFRDYCFCMSLLCCGLGVIAVVCAFPEIQEILRAYVRSVCFPYHPLELAGYIIDGWRSYEILQAFHARQEEQSISSSPFTHAFPPDVEFEWSSAFAPDVERWSPPEARQLHEDALLPSQEQPPQESRASLQTRANRENVTVASHSMRSATEAIVSEASTHRHRNSRSLNEGHSPVPSFRNPQSPESRHLLVRLYDRNVQWGSTIRDREAPSSCPMFIENPDPQESADFGGHSSDGADSFET